MTEFEDESPEKRTSVEVRSLQSLRDAFRIARERAGLTIDELAAKANLDRKTVMDIEKTGHVRLISMMSIIDALGMSMTLNVGGPALKTAAGVLPGDEDGEIPVEEMDIEVGGMKP